MFFQECHVKKTPNVVHNCADWWLDVAGLPVAMIQQIHTEHTRWSTLWSDLAQFTLRMIQVPSIWNLAMTSCGPTSVDLSYDVHLLLGTLGTLENAYLPMAPLWRFMICKLFELYRSKLFDEFAPTILTQIKNQRSKPLTRSITAWWL